MDKWVGILVKISMFLSPKCYNLDTEMKVRNRSVTS
jgi:hypothetical protein